MKIKYRVWDGKTMWYPHESKNPFSMNPSGTVITVKSSKDGKSIDMTLRLDCYTMLWTGLEDVNGSYIFDGDITKNGIGVIYEIYWHKQICAFYQRICNKENFERQGYD